jgi:hypothetical protein
MEISFMFMFLPDPFLYMACRRGRSRLVNLDGNF